mmetsp:Transcript_1810/g.4485  ORF Transcript_1810/g.4485 Transcript_1810/m.4485 type:complete len:410 (-) Transcript_1810:485-1714(-)
MLGLVEILRQHVPRLEADAEDFGVTDLADSDEVEESGDEDLVRLRRLQDFEMRLDESREEERQFLDEEPIVLRATVEGRLQRRFRGEYFGELLEELGEELAEERVVLRLQVLQRADLREAIERVVAEHGFREEFEEDVDELRLEYESQRNPREEALQGLQSHPEQAGRLGMLEDEEAELEDELELAVEGLLEALDLFRDHLIPGKVEDLLRKQLEYLHVVLAEHLRALGRADQVGDEALPVVRPLVLENLDEREVELSDEDPLRLHGGFVLRHFDNFPHYVRFDPLPLVGWEDFPSRLDGIVQHLQSEEPRIGIRGLLDDPVRLLPQVRRFLQLHERLVGRSPVRADRIVGRADHLIQQRDIKVPIAGAGRKQLLRDLLYRRHGACLLLCLRVAYCVLRIVSAPLLVCL